MKLLLKRIASYFPTKFPVGNTAYEAWLTSIIELAGPFADKDSMDWAISNMGLHLDSKVDRKPKQYFVRCLRKAAFNQLASHKFQSIKEKQAAAQKAAEEAAKAAAPAPEVIQPVEATTPPSVVANETKEAAKS